MPFKYVSALAATLFSIHAGAASAASVTLTFEEDRAELLDLATGPDRYDIQGRVSESGFETRFDITAIGRDPDTALSEGFYSSPFVSDCGGCFSVSTVNSLSVKRSDGRSFSLDRVDIGFTDLRIIKLLDFVPFDETGTPDYAAATEVGTPFLYDNLFLTGYRADGSMTEVSTSTFAGRRDGDSFRVFGGKALEFDATDTLTDLVALSIRVGSDRFDEQQNAKYEIANGGYAGEFYRTVTSECPDSLTSCEVPGVGIFGTDEFFTGNWSTATRLDAMTFTLDTPPAPVPLPAAGLMLVAGLGVLGGLRRVA